MSAASFEHGGYPPRSFIPLPETLAEFELEYARYEGEHQLPDIVQLIEKELSEPYIVYTYRYFLLEWPHLCYIASVRSTAPDQPWTSSRPVGVIIAKLDQHSKGSRLMRGYIAMLSVHTAWRGRGIAKKLARLSVDEMIRRGAEEIVLETEIDNAGALALYHSLEFVREKRLYRFYLNGKDAFRLAYPITEGRQGA